MLSGGIFFYIEPAVVASCAFGFSFCAILLVGKWTQFNSMEYAKTWKVDMDGF